ncbi:hypothetical protein ACE6H2_020552 [Prunus campanulata]
MVQLCSCLLALSLCVIALFKFYPLFPYSEEKVYVAKKLFIYSSHDDARGYRFKVIENWDDIVDLCGKYRATGEDAETGADETEVMTPTNEVDHRRNRASNSYVILPTKKRGVVKDVIANSIARMTLSFEEFICVDTKGSFGTPY